MQWDDLVFTGTRGKWMWLATRHEIVDLARLTIESHKGWRVLITAFDFGPIIGWEGCTDGWTMCDDAVFSPPLTLGLDIPYDEGSEMYVLRAMPESTEGVDRYVRYSGFNLADPAALAASQDPTWDQTNYDWLIPIQEHFWRDIDRLDPMSYISSGDLDIVVTADPVFAKLIQDVAHGTTS